MMVTKENNYTVNEHGYYGNYGGAFVPEMLYPNVKELQDNYLKIIYEESFQKEFIELLRDFAGRPTPLFFAKRLSEKYAAKIFLKREDLCHTGAHKINNTIGQILLAQRLGKKRIIAETGAGQHGVATATVCALKGVECIVYMGEKDIERQAPNVARMKMLGATVIPATSGSKTLLQVISTSQAPTIAITRSASNVVLSWPTWAGDFVLQTMESISNQPPLWTNAPGKMQTNGGEIQVSLPVSNNARFFRLHR